MAKQFYGDATELDKHLDERAKWLQASVDLSDNLIEIANCLKEYARPSHNAGQNLTELRNDCQTVIEKTNAALRQVLNLVEGNEAQGDGAVLLHVFYYCIQGVEEIDSADLNGNLEDAIEMDLKSLFANAYLECHADLIRLASKYMVPMLRGILLQSEQRTRVDRSWTTGEIAREAKQFYDRDDGLPPDTDSVLSCLKSACDRCREEPPKKKNGEKSLRWPRSLLERIFLCIPEGQEVGFVVREAVSSLTAKDSLRQSDS